MSHIHIVIFVLICFLFFFVDTDTAELPALDQRKDLVLYPMTETVYRFFLASQNRIRNCKVNDSNCKQRINGINSHSFFMALACWSMKILTTCRTACQTLQSVYWAAGDTGQPRMSASDLFSSQLLSVTASCLKQTIFVSQCNYHHLVILTMLTASTLQTL